ncbi:hypothetical protein DFH29DRAFT_882564 [Suillus ampliporus]|nr:hypothetical protein DFH29DRAFT_882564 [Suillus ampliporus]
MLERNHARTVSALALELSIPQLPNMLSRFLFLIPLSHEPPRLNLVQQLQGFRIGKTWLAVLLVMASQYVVGLQPQFYFNQSLGHRPFDVSDCPEEPRLSTQLEVSIHMVSWTPKISVNVGRWWQATGLIFNALDNQTLGLPAQCDAQELGLLAQMAELQTKVTQQEACKSSSKTLALPPSHVSQSFVDDLESLFYVFTYVCIQYSSPNSEERLEPVPDSLPDSWSTLDLYLNWAVIEQQENRRDHLSEGGDACLVGDHYTLNECN